MNVTVVCTSFVVGMACGAALLGFVHHKKRNAEGMVVSKDASGREYKFRIPSWNRFCHICGADSFKRESCDCGLHS